MQKKKESKRILRDYVTTTIYYGMALALFAMSRSEHLSVLQCFFKIPRPGQLDVYTSIPTRLNTNTPFRSALGNQLNTGQRQPSFCSVPSLPLLTAAQVENSTKSAFPREEPVTLQSLIKILCALRCIHLTHLRLLSRLL